MSQRTINGRAVARGALGHQPSPINAGECPATAAAGGRPSPPSPNTPAPARRAAAAGRCTPRRSRGTLKDGRRRPEPCGGCSASRQSLCKKRAPAPRNPLDSSSQLSSDEACPVSLNVALFRLPPRLPGTLLVNVFDNGLRLPDRRRINRLERCVRPLEGRSRS